MHVIGLFATLPDVTADVAARAAIGAACLPVVLWVIRGLQRGRWSFVAGSPAWRRAVTTLIVCGAVVGALIATSMLAADARRLAGAPVGGARLDAEEAAALVEVQEWYGVNVVLVDGWLGLTRAAAPAVTVETFTGSSPVGEECELRYGGRRSASAGAASRGGAASRPVAGRGPVLRLLCDGREVAVQDSPVGVRVETEPADAVNDVGHAVRVYVGAVGGGLGAVAFVVFMLYSIGPRRSGDVEWLQIVRDPDLSGLGAARKQALVRQRRRMRADPAQRAAVKAFVSAVARRVPGTEAMADDAVDRTILRATDRMHARYLLSTGHPDGELFRPQPDHLGRGLFVSMAWFVLAGVALWGWSHVESSPWSNDVVLTDGHVRSYVDHYETAGFDVRLPEESTPRAPGPFLSEVRATRGDEVCRGELVSGFAVMKCRDAGVTRRR